MNLKLTPENEILLQMVCDWSKLDSSKLVNNALTLYFRQVIISLETIASCPDVSVFDKSLRDKLSVKYD